MLFRVKNGYNMYVDVMFGCGLIIHIAIAHVQFFLFIRVEHK